MTRIMYDAVQAANIPADAEVVAGFVDMDAVWSAKDWARFPNAVKVRIAVNPATNDGHVIDIEYGNWDAAASVDWVLMRRASGLATPAVYCGTGVPGYTWSDVLNAHAARGVPPPLIWLASWGTDQSIPAGCIGKQFEADGPYDRSIVQDYWEGVDPAPAPPSGPDVPSAQGRLDEIIAAAQAAKQDLNA